MILVHIFCTNFARILQLVLSHYVATIMPRCQGRPSEECPLQRNDTSVRSTQGDLFLCPDCEEFRFPTARTSAQLSSKPTAAGKKQATNKNRAAAPTVKDAIKDANTGKSNKLATESKSWQSDDGEDCVYCREAITVSTASIRCDVCKHVYHQPCSSLSADVFSVLNTIINHAGWVCRQCRNQFESVKCSLKSNRRAG